MSAPSATPRTLINGRAQDSVSAFDRGLLLGDGLFETIAIRQGRAPLWLSHCERLERGCHALALPAPDRSVIADEVERACADGRHGTVRLTLTRGLGPRGYAQPERIEPMRVVTFHPGQPATAAQPLRLRWCDFRLGLQPALAGIKHLNRIEQVMARAEWSDPRIDEGIVQSLDGRVIECVAANLFLVRREALVTPRIRDCGVAGVARRQVLTTAASLGLASEERDVFPDEVMDADEVFVTSSVRGIAPVGHIDDASYAAPGAVTEQLIRHSDWLT